MRSNRMLSGVCLASLWAAMTATGCGDAKLKEITNVDSTSPPVMPMPMPGTGVLAGRVVNAAGEPVAGAAVLVAETDAVTMSDAAGAYQLTVLADSTITLVTTADGFAKSYRESVVVADQAMIPSFDVLLLPSDMMTRFAAMGADESPTRGVMAVRLHSLNDACATAGAHIAVWPPRTGTVFYSQPAATAGALDEPNEAITATQAGVRIDAWVVGAASPGSQLTITVDQTGCHLVSPSPSISGVQFPGLRPSGRRR